MATASTMILSALISIGDKAIGGSLTAAEQTEYLSRLNQMLESWSIDGLIVYTTQTITKALTAGTGTYTIGTGQSIDVAYPIKITSAYTIDASNVSRDIPNFVDGDDWGQITLKLLGNSYPNTLWWDNTFPNGNINLWPLPVSGLTLYLNVYTRLQSLGAIGTMLSLPPGYEEAIISNLAIRLAAGAIAANAEIREIAKESLARIKRANVSVPVLGLPKAIVGGSDWYYQFPIPR